MEEGSCLMTPALEGPALEGEGPALAITPTFRREIREPVNQLRDPYSVQNVNDELNLLYAGAGEKAIGVVN